MQIKLDKNLTYLVACSFGPDSMALLDVLVKESYKVIVAHVNYKMRDEESEKETEGLLKYTTENRIDTYIKYVDGKSIIGNFQAEARKIRYQFFRDLKDQVKFDILLTAHHADDHLETYFMQKDSNRQNFHFGILANTVIENVEVKRPLLGYFKSDLIKYCQKHDVPYSVDSSNFENKYARNKVRNERINKLTKSEKEELLHLILNENNNLQKVRNELEKHIINGMVVIEDFCTLHPNLQTNLLYLLYFHHNIAERFNANKAVALKKVVFSKRSSVFMKVEDTIYVVKFEGKFAFINKKNYEPYSYTISEAKTYYFPQFTVKLDDKLVVPQINNEQYPLTISSANEGDEYEIKGYKKAINRLFIDMKMPRHYRLIWPVVKNKKGKIIYVPRYRKDYQAKESDLFLINLGL